MKFICCLVSFTLSLLTLLPVSAQAESTPSQWHYGSQAEQDGITRYQLQSGDHNMTLFCRGGDALASSQQGAVYLQVATGKLDAQLVQKVEWQAVSKRRDGKGELPFDDKQQHQLQTPFALLSFQEAKLLQSHQQLQGKQQSKEFASTKFQGVEGELMQQAAEQWRFINQLRKAEQLTLILWGNNNELLRHQIELHQFSPLFQRFYYQCDYLRQQEKNNSIIVM